MSAKVQVDKYRAALQRLIACGDPISNDAVALEAGSRRGAIKRSRSAYQELIKEIDAAEAARVVKVEAADPVPKLREGITRLTRRLDQALERELCLLHEVYTLREENRQLKLGRPFLLSK